MVTFLRVRKLTAPIVAVLLIMTGHFVGSGSGRSIKGSKKQPRFTLAAAKPKADKIDGTDDYSPQAITNEDAQRKVLEDLNKLPFVFEQNEGQTNNEVQFMARGQGYGLFLTPTEAVLNLYPLKSKEHRVTKGTHRTDYFNQQHHHPQTVRRASSAVIRMDLIAANRSPRMKGEAEQLLKTHYFVGNDPTRWHIARRFERVRYEQVYPGVDMIYYGQQQELEYDFEVAPFADANRIRLRYQGAERIFINNEGELVLRMRDGREVKHRQPVAYQESNGGRREVKCRYLMVGKRIVGLKLGEYDQALKLVIDPVLSYATYLGGSGDDFNFNSSIAVDNSGNAYITGRTDSTNFPLRNQYQSDQTGIDVFVAKLNTNAAGEVSLVYSTYLGGTGTELGFGIAVDTSGNAYVTGVTDSNNFPVRNQYQTVQAFDDSFVTKLNTNATGDASLVYSTYLGGDTFDYGNSIAADALGHAYITGSTQSTNFPLRNQYQMNQPDYDAFMTELDTNASGDASLIYSTYLGGNLDSDSGNGIAIDASGYTYVTGTTRSANFPTRGQYQTAQSGYDAFVTKFNTSLSGDASLIYSTYLGGNGFDYGFGIAIDNSGDAYVVGRTDSVNMLVRNQYQTKQGSVDVFVMRLRDATPLKISEFDGDRKTDISIWRPAEGNWYIKNSTNGLQTVRQWGLSTDIITPGDYDGDAKTDIAVFRPSEGNWYVIQSGTGAGRVQGWGDATDIPVPADYDGDLKTDIAVYRPSEGNWYIIQSATNTVRLQNWGTSGDKPVRGDYDGDGKADLAVFRPSEGNWYILQSATNTILLRNWGTNTDIPVPADYTGDARTDIAVYRPSEGNWYIIIQIESNTARLQQWGTSSDVPVPGDYDDDGRADIGVWRPSEGNYYIIQSRTNTGRVDQLGQPSDVPVPSSYLSQ